MKCSSISMPEKRPVSSSRPARYALITPVRDEEKYLGAAMESVLAQTVLPAKWIIVDDGSTDRTPDILRSYESRVSFLEAIRLPPRAERKPGGEGAIAYALNRMNLSEYDFLARFDADLLFEPDYIQRILAEFAANPRLGIAGGGLYLEHRGQLKLERVPDYHVRGALKMYRRECFEQIGGLSAGIGWDTIDEVYAWTKGWITRSFFQHRVIHCRPTGHGVRASRIYWERGKAEYYTWSHPLFVFAKVFKLAWETRSVLKPVSFLCGFLFRYAKRDKRLQDPLFARTRRAQQLHRAAALLIRRQPDTASARLPGFLGS